MASSAVAEVGLKSFTLAGLQAAASHSQGLLRLPPSLQAAITAFLGDMPSREVKRNVARLSGTMRARKAAGMVPVDPQEVEGLEDAHAAVEEYMGRTSTHNRLSKSLFTPIQAPVRFEYEENKTAAYVAARMPAVYGAVHRVLSEVASRLPKFQPKRMLDYGSGPGTVLWAMREVWPGAVEHVNLVESSRAMTDACRNLLQDVEQLPLIKVHPSLPALSRGLRKSERQHDVVIASYALGELPSKEERITTIRQLWALTHDLLVLIEPGTPQGSSLVREIRAHILQMERKKMRRRFKGGKQTAEEGCQAAGEEQDGCGAYVIAPCAHDGACPMDKTEKWCHFTQRVERTSSQRITKRHSASALRTYEDEKFSFVVLRRGTRPRIPWPLERLKLESPEDPQPHFQIIEDVTSEGGVGTMEGKEFSSEVSDEEFEDFEGLTSGGSEDEFEEGEGDDEIEEVEGPKQVADMGSGWARIVRAPIRRGRHTILDLCCASERDGSSGALNRLVCSRRGQCGHLHPQARKAWWGDLWPC